MNESCKTFDEHESGVLLLKSNEHRTETAVQDADSLSVRVTRYRKLVCNYESYIVFRVVTETGRSEFGGRTNFVVERRYRTFEWLHSRLTQSNPALFVPPLPGKMLTSMLDRYSEAFLSGRLWGLDIFITRVARHPILSSNTDLIAFLTLSSEEFEDHRSKCSPAGVISSLLADTHLGITNLASPSDVTVSVTSTSSSSHTGSTSESLTLAEATLGLLGTNAMHQYRLEFKELCEQASVFSEIAQNMAQTTDIIISHLDGLSSGFSDLARCLDTWPPSLTVEPDDWINSTDPTDAHLSVNRTRHLQGPSLLGRTLELVGNETSELGSRLRKQTLLNWRESALYADSILHVFGLRDELEKRYFRTSDQLQKQVTHLANAQEKRLAVTAKSYFKWHEQSLTDLVSDVHRLQDRVTLSNGQIRAEFERWQVERRAETLHNLLEMAEIYMNYWTRIAGNWRSTLADLQSTNSNNQGTSASGDCQHASSEATEYERDSVESGTVD